MTSETVRRFVDAQNNLVVQHSDFSLRALADMASAGSIDLDPHYQRRDRWKPDKQSALIESFILNVPVPPVYLSEDDFGRYSVIDGKQRLTAIRDFLIGDLRLRHLHRFRELEGYRFVDLPPQIQNALSIRPYIRVITLLKQTNPDLKYEVFLRLNTGGDKLLPQEIRNVAFSGPLNELLYELSSNQFLWQQMKIQSEATIAYRKMEDVEHVLRFFTIQQRWQSIGQVPADEMDSFMQQNQHLSSEGIDRLRTLFGTSIEACERIWGTHAFHKPRGEGWRDQFISPLFEAEMVATSLLSASQLTKIVKQRDRVIRDFPLFYRDDPQFAKSVNQATNNPGNVKYRIAALTQFMKGFA